MSSKASKASAWPSSVSIPTPSGAPAAKLTRSPRPWEFCWPKTRRIYSHGSADAEVADWLDSHGDDLTDYRDVGRGVKADMVVGIDLLSFNLHEGQTLLKGRAKVGVKVYAHDEEGRRDGL